MLDRMTLGRVPGKHHIVFRSAEGQLLHEECLTRDGFEGPYSILYHQHRPHAQRIVEVTRPLRALSEEQSSAGLRKRHFRSLAVSGDAGAPLAARVPLLFNEDVAFSIARPQNDDTAYFSNGDADDLYYVFEGGGVLRSVFGDLRFSKDDYVFVPRGVTHRFLLDEGPQTWFSMELFGGLHFPRQFRNDVGQLRMDAPYCHRDFRRPEFVGPIDEDIRTTIVKRKGALHGLLHEASPLDVVGWDGTVYPWAFPILAFQPRAGLVHLPPTWHGTFAARGALICSFVPRVVDFHPEAIPCPYPHSSVDVDEVLFYCRGNFTSRRGVGPGSISFHPAGLPHGPHPGAYEASLGTKTTNELAVMADCARPLRVTPEAVSVEDAGYQDSFLDSRF